MLAYLTNKTDSDLVFPSFMLFVHVMQYNCQES